MCSKLRVLRVVSCAHGVGTQRGHRAKQGQQSAKRKAQTPHAVNRAVYALLPRLTAGALGPSIVVSLNTNKSSSSSSSSPHYGSSKHHSVHMTELANGGFNSNIQIYYFSFLRASVFLKFCTRNLCRRVQRTLQA